MKMEVNSREIEFEYSDESRLTLRLSEDEFFDGSQSSEHGHFLPLAR